MMFGGRPSPRSGTRPAVHVFAAEAAVVVTFERRFVLYGTPEAVPRLVSLLAESYNPHVR
jgi:hypothetical protein